VKKTSKEIKELETCLRAGLFASKDSVPEGYEYCMDLLKAALPKDNHIAAYTAVHVLLNSISDALAHIHKDIPDAG